MLLSERGNSSETSWIIIKTKTPTWIWSNQEFLSQTNENEDSVPEKERFKFVDDLTALETINLLNIGLCSYNFKQHKATVPEGGYFIDSKNLDSQMYLDKINQWTVNQKMQLNKNKTKAMIINYTNKYQFNTRLQLDKSNIVLLNSMKILGTIIKYDLTWGDNTNNIIRKVNKRMLLLKKIHSFGASPKTWFSCGRYTADQFWSSPQ